MTDQTREAARFGRVQLSPRRRELVVDGVPVPVGGRAFDILELLVEAQGDLVTKDEIMRRVWPGAVVEENTLQVHVSALRKALGGDRWLIRTVSGRGYRLVIEPHPDDRGEGARYGGPATAPPLAASNLPVPASELIGREAELDQVTGLLRSHRIVTLTGAGGVGKTRLGLEVARRLLPGCADGVWLVDLAPLADASLIPAVVATAAGLQLGGAEPSAERIARALGGRRLLLVLDNCEHVIDAAAAVAEALTRAGSEARLLATSREPLRVEGERVHQVPPLDVPPDDATEPETLLRHGAVRLFIERTRAAEPRFEPEARGLIAVGAVCRHLDGIPLAIELAAARTAALGVEVVAARLDDRFGLLAGGGRRTALPRHRTLRATLDWSYELLSARERLVFRRLAAFPGGFTLEAACAVATVAETGVPEVVDAVADLVAKSMVAAELGGSAAPRYRLLETMRAYASGELVESGELEATARRHAAFYRDLFERAEAEWESRSAAGWLDTCRREIDNLRAALDWAFSSSGDAPLGVALAAVTVPLMFDLTMVDECRGLAERALAVITPGSIADARREMRLRAALAVALVSTRGPDRRAVAAWTDLLTIAMRLEDADHQARALWGLWSAHLYSGAPRAALPFAERFLDLAASRADEAKELLGERVVGVTLHYMGDQVPARRHIERVLARYARAVHGWQTTGFRIDHAIMARATLVRILWLQGFPDQAVRMRDEVVSAARDHVMSSCYVLMEAAIPLALLAGDVAGARRFLAMLLDLTERHGYPVWQAWGRCFEATLLVGSGDVAARLSLQRLAADELRRTGFGADLTACLGLLAEILGRAGLVVEGLAAIGEAIERSEGDGERWFVAELLRVRGELRLREGLPGAAAVAEEDFRRSLELARGQDALAWELRAATSLARLWQQQGRPAEARKLLRPIRHRFTEGLATLDLKAATTLLG